MNEEIILSMIAPYIKDGAITYNQFDGLFSILSIKEQYSVVEILYKNGINLIDEQINEENFVLEMDEDLSDEDDFQILYDESIFKDKGISEETIISHKFVNQSNENLCALIQQGNKQAVQDICIKNKRLVDKYVMAYRKRYGNRLDFEDLEQVGFMGLIKAANKFDFAQGNAFSTYAVFWIKQAISREIMDNGYAIRIPVHMMERINKVVSLDNQLSEEYSTVKERIPLIAVEIGLTDTDVWECLILKNNILTYSSLDAPIGEDQDSYLGEMIPDNETPSIEDIVSNRMLREQLEKLLSTLSVREQKIIRLRFGLDDGIPKTLETVGQSFNVTRERIRQIEAKALRKLNHPKKSEKLKDFL